MFQVNNLPSNIRYCFSDTQGAMEVLQSMKSAGIEPSEGTYTVIMCSYAEVGDLDAIKQVCVYCRKAVALHIN